MTLSDLGNIGEFVGALGVIGSLLYVGVQIRQNTAEQRAKAFQESSKSLSEMIQLAAKDLSVSRLYRIGITLEEPLTPDEQMQFDLLIIGLFRSFENMHFQYTRGNETELWRYVGDDVAIMLSLPGIRDWWERNPFSFSPEFTDFVESRLQELNA